MHKRLRLRHADDFTRLRQDGRVYRHPLLILSVLPNDLPHNRYGFITAKRLGNAVKRNRARRLLREAVRLLHPQLRAGYDVVIIARPQVVGQPFTAVQSAILQTMRRAHLTNE